MFKRQQVLLVTFILVFITILGLTPIFYSLTNIPEPIPTEAPAVSEPESTSTPRRPEITKITFVYDYGYVPKNWIEHYVLQETVRFTSNSSGWNRVPLTPITINKGPLFLITIDYPTNKTGNCVINSYFNDTAQRTVLEVQPVCHIPYSEETVQVNFRLANCNLSDQQTLLCSTTGTFGTLQYTLNAHQNIFEYQYSGQWDLNYESAINDTLNILGFTPPTTEFYRNLKPGEITTIQK